ncbi:MAG: DUF523 domain-containing protein [Desulfotalea sp.]
MSTKTYIVSACLVGLCTRYDGKLKTSSNCLDTLQGCTWIPLCPEQLGGLATPREPADIAGGTGYDVLKGNAKVIDKKGEDLTSAFIKGAKQVLEIAKAQNVDGIFLKSRSPSCGFGEKIGVTAALLDENGFEVIEYS